MLDTIKIGMVILDEKNAPIGYMRSIKKNKPNEIYSYFRVPLSVAFDSEGYDTYKKYLSKTDPEFKTWVSKICLKVPPPLSSAKAHANAGHEMFLGKLRDLSTKYPKFPKDLKKEISHAIREYALAKQSSPPPPESWDEVEEYVSPESELAAHYAIDLYSKLQRSRFDLGRPERRGEFLIKPFVRLQGDKGAREVIGQFSKLVCDYLLKNPKVSKYSETDGKPLRIKLACLFLECAYKEQLYFMQSKLKQFS